MGKVTTLYPAAPAQPNLEAPGRIDSTHDLSAFDSGSKQLDDWLRRRALHNEANGASRTYVVCQRTRVVAFYCLANGAMMRANAPGKIRRNVPDPIPVMVLGRLAVDRKFQGQGLGEGLLRDAISRTVQAAEIAGIRAILVHTKDEQARQWYERFGVFIPSPTDSLTLLLPLQSAVEAFGPAP
jgi:GNAT superfamily N-acetyltransferase